jgi:argininosuccinate synthase
MIVGITGHANLTDSTIEPVYYSMRAELAKFRGAELVGLTCLARGADQVFADVVLDLGGDIEVVVPSADYFDRIKDQASRDRCDAYLARASAIHSLPYAFANDDAYFAASREVVDRSDLLVAVWDGSRGSGTGQAVAYAHGAGQDVAIVWPEGAARRPSA